MHMMGQLSGEVRAMHAGLTARVQDIKMDIARLENSQNERMQRIEDGLGKRIDGLGTRVTALESEDKRMIEKVAKFGAAGGGIGGILAAAAIELVKMMK